ncbi:YdcF family protein [Sulfurovum sp. NBC37-1]|uniref:YdcF family protein n=1 Tax=Sulfurovum sp. (strain NBC37-1) TaxID=387093 RepID=UPI0001587B23|nr:YdcF family protein [Sulfurovum sp. NBC37-1]BAF72474.1 conserved hypothetical protein [Sulfurovum sp. NBC37-1]
MMKKRGMVLLLVLLVFFCIVFANLGKWLDVTDKPVESDIIICLGGGDYHRIDKAIALYRAGYSMKHLLVLTGDDVTPVRKRAGYKDFRVRLLEKKYTTIPYSHVPGLLSTREEVLFIKRYMLSRGYRSALIVSDPPHLGRVAFLSQVLSVYGDSALQWHYVGSGVKWWDREHYYRNETARHYALTELLKIPYNLYKLCCDN